MKTVRIARLSCVLLIVATLAIAAAADKKKDVLPAPTGPLAIGRTTFYWKVDTAAKPVKGESQDSRELRVDVWYPAEPAAAAAKAAYCPDLPAIKSHMDLAAVAQANVETHALVDPPISTAQPRYAVLLLSPGLNTNAVNYTALVEELVSHGYVVATVDHPFQSAAIAYPDGRVIAFKDAPKVPLDARDQIFGDYKTRVSARVIDLRFVLDQLTALDEGSLDARFRGRFDLRRVGVVGHSIGGVAAAEACMQDPRFKAAVNMDGHVRSLPLLPGDQGAGPRQPFLELTDAAPDKPPTDAQLAKWKTTRADFERAQQESARRANDLMRTIAGGSFRVTIAGANHQTFSDSVLWTAANPRPHYQRVRIIRDYVRAFFDKHLCEKSATLLDEASSPYQEATVERFGAAK